MENSCLRVLKTARTLLFVFVQNVRVRAAFPLDYFELLFSSENGTYHRVRTLLKGDTIIDGELDAVIGDVSVTSMTGTSAV